MKKYLNQLLVIAALIIVGCSDDPCKDVVCGPGTCDDGTCICPEGYSGTSCEILENDKYFGSYNITMDNCGVFPPGVGTFIIEAKSDGGPFDITIRALIGSIQAGSANGTILNDKIEASGSVQNLAFSVSGDFTDTNSFSGVYELQGAEEPCPFSMAK